MANGLSNTTTGIAGPQGHAIDGPPGEGSRDQRPRYPQLFEPRRRSAHASHPVLASGAIFLAAFGILAVIFIGLGALVTHVLAHSSLGHADEHLNVWLARHRTKGLNSVSLALTRVGDVAGITIVAAAVTILLAVRKWGRISLFLVIGLALELALFELTEHFVARPRPAVHHLGVTPPTYSWPSGHTAATVVVYGGIALLVAAATRKVVPRVLSWIVAVVLTLGVGWSRIYEGEHHLTDTIGGVLLGASCLCAAVLVLRAWSGRSEMAQKHAASTVTRSHRRALQST